MPQGYCRDVIKAIRELGFRQVPGGKGSHEKWVDAQGHLVIVPRNLMSRHTANGILKSAGAAKRL